MDYQDQSMEYVEMPADYKVWSIVNIVLSVLTCCCSICAIITNLASLILAILALLKGNEVAGLMAQGEQGLIQAQEVSKKAKLFNIIASALIAVNVILFIIGFIFGFMGQFMTILPFLYN